MKKYIFSILLSTCIANAFAQLPSYIYTKATGVNYFSSYLATFNSYGVSVSKNNNSFVQLDSSVVNMHRAFIDTFDVDPSTQTTVINTYMDFYLQRLDANANLMNHFVYHSLQVTNDVDDLYDYISDYCMDKNGNIYAIGSYNYHLDFNANAAIDTLPGQGFFMCKLAPDSSLLWVKKIGFFVSVNNYSGASPMNIALGNNNNIIVTYKNDSQIFDLDPNATVVLSPLCNGQSIDIVCYDSNGNYQSSNNISGFYSYDFGCTDLKCDAEGNIVFSGMVAGIPTFSSIYNNFYFGTQDTITSSAGYDCLGFIAKLDTALQYAWVNKIDFSDSFCNHSYGFGSFVRATVDVHNNIVCNVGIVSQAFGKMYAQNGILSVATNVGNNMVFRLDAAGNYLWGKAYGSDVNEVYCINGSGSAQINPNFCYTSHVVTHPGNADIWLSGAFCTKADFDPNDSTVIPEITDSLAGKSFILILDSNGIYKHHITNGTNQYPNFGIYAGNNCATQIAFAEKNSAAYVKGLYKEKAYFGDATNSDTLINLVGTPGNPQIKVIINKVYLSKYKICENYYDTLQIKSCTADYIWQGNSYNTSGTYFNNYKSHFGCDSNFILQLQIININANISINADTLSALPSGASYQWIDCSTNLPIANETNQSFLATANGVYACNVTINGCTETSNCITVNHLALQLENLASVYLLPTTVASEYTVHLPVDAKNYKVQVFDCIGKKIEEFSLTSNKSSILPTIKLPSAGLFLVSIYSSSNKYIFKVIGK
jgi:hypothetical protein